MGWLIALAVLVILAWIPLGASARYDECGFLALLILGPVRIRFYPGKKNKEKKPKKQKAKKGSSEKSQPAEQKKKGGPISDFLPFARILWDFLKDFKRKLRVNVLEMNLVLGGGDPCDLAENYGKACAAMGNLWPRLEEFLVIRRRDVKIQCDFEASGTLVTARLDLTLTLGRLLALVCRYGYKLLKEYIQFKNKRKGGASI